MAEQPTAELAAIWAEVGGLLVGFVRRHVTDPNDADDVLAEVLVRLHQHLGDVDDDQRVTAWVWRVTRNAIADHHRHVARRRETPGIYAEPTPERGSDGWIDDNETVVSELAACIRPLISTLPEQYRRALEFTDLGGRTQAEAAAIEGISVSGMKSRVQRARRLLVHQIEACCDVTTDRRGTPVGFQVCRDGGGCPAPCDPG